ncbi:3'(2'),5'-bisphosphate nucleotidase CysQ [Pseudovibrio sp. SPO723]|uniref:3'(2'),5'-bisphosphate nucleotidase CysQ n=1 Tax=Nesiotobacter zosterae TaxID=392721 RepID=UPI0029C35825|nr:3'(2'),5'-bisphosphate nucleotidase CysQ [Pseudovibrio sp. SPO723]MDX5592851.1 3'(2'),5'-bisphosphate nucleotidase CysQ [Pseudovibrio sp. SPO723]
MIEKFKEAALVAGQEAMKIYETDFMVEDKEDGSPVTIADQAAEDVIIKILGEAFPDLTVIGEESTAAGKVPETCNRFVIVDPIDGTKEFIKKNGEFTVNIGLIEDGVAIAGVVYAPALGELYWGDCHNGAFKATVENNKIVSTKPIRSRGLDENNVVVLASRSHRTPETQSLIDRLGNVEVMAAGSSLKFCRLAEGAADFYPRLSPTMEWDTAAGQAVLTAAGGATIVSGGEPLLYNKRDETNQRAFENPFFIAVGDEQIISRFSLKTGW